MKTKKISKLASFLLVLSLICAPFHGLSQAISTDLEWVSGVTSIAGGLLIQQKDTYTLFDENGTETALSINNNPFASFPKLAQGYGFDLDTGAIYQPTIADDCLTWSEIAKPSQQLADLLAQGQDVVLLNGGVYVSVPVDDQLWMDVYQYSLDDQTSTKLSFTDVYAIGGYDDTQLLIVCNDILTMQYQFYVWNQETGKRSIWGEMDNSFLLDQFSGMVYDKPNQCVCFSLGDRVYRWESGKTPSIIGYRASLTLATAAALAPDGTYLCLANAQLQRFSSEMFTQTRTLTLSGSSFSSDMNPAFAQQYPEIPVHFLWDYSTEQLLTDLTTRQAQADIFVMNTSYELYDMLRKKGFCADLSSSSSLVAFTNELYPEIYQWAVWEERPIAVPYELSTSYIIGINESLQKELNIETPKTYKELITLYAQWEDINAAHGDAYTLYSSGFATERSIMTYHFTDLYIASTPEPLDFEDPAFVDMLTYMDQCNSSIWRSEVGSSDTRMPLLKDGLPLLATDTGMPSDQPNYVAMPIQLDEDHEAIIPASLTMLVVNAASPNQDIAIKYLECLVGDYGAEASIMLLDKPAEPVEDDAYQENMAYYTKEKEDLLAKLSKADPAEKAELEEQLDFTNICLWECKAMRWYISQEDIEKYQAIAPAIRILPGVSAGYYSSLPNMSKTWHDYVNEIIPAAEYVKKLNNIQKMINAEQ